MATLAAVLEVPSTSSDKMYRVWVGELGPIFCECPAHKFTRGKPAGQRPDCKHMKAIRSDTALYAKAVALAKEADQLKRDAAAAKRAALGQRATVPRVTPGEAQRKEPAHQDRRIRFIEVQEQTETGVWVGFTLGRFAHLEMEV
jgi:hypothetical protein